MVMNLADHFLIAMPAVNEYSSNNIFDNSLVYITEHNMGGAIGVIVNKPLGKIAKSVFQNVNIMEYNPLWAESNLYLGGPVNASNGFILHRSLQSDDKFELTGNKDMLDKIAASTYNNDVFISVGYASWSPFQIEAEVRLNSWLVVKAIPELIFDVAPTDRYNEAMRLLGITDLSSLYCVGHSIA